MVEAAEEPDRLLDGELLGELGLLKRDPQQLAELAVVLPPAPAEDQHFSLVGLGEPLADLDGGGLSGAVGAQQAEALPGTDL
jgi:hypothetical protein